MKQNYVNFHFPGTFFAESSSRKVESFNPQEVLRDLPKNCFMFQFFWREEVKAPDSDEILFGSNHWDNKKYYPGGKIVPLSEMRKQYGNNPDFKILLSNIECNSKIGCGLLCRTGNWQCADMDSVIV